MPTTPTQKFLTPHQLSDRWANRINVRTLANWRTAGTGPQYVKVGGAIMYRITDVETWENRNTVRSTSQYGAIGAA